MAQGWWKENWEDIKYAHKSVWLSMAVFLLIGYYGIWCIAEYGCSRKLAEKDAIINRLNTQIIQLQKVKGRASQDKNAQQQNSGIPEHSTDSTLDSLERTKDDVTNRLYQEGIVGNR